MNCLTNAVLMIKGHSQVEQIVGMAGIDGDGFGIGQASFGPLVSPRMQIAQCKSQRGAFRMLGNQRLQAAFGFEGIVGAGWRSPKGRLGGRIDRIGLSGPLAQFVCFFALAAVLCQGGQPEQDVRVFRREAQRPFEAGMGCFEVVSK